MTFFAFLPETAKSPKTPKIAVSRGSHRAALLRVQAEICAVTFLREELSAAHFAGRSRTGPARSRPLQTALSEVLGTSTGQTSILKNAPKRPKFGSKRFFDLQNRFFGPSLPQNSRPTCFVEFSLKIQILLMRSLPTEGLAEPRRTARKAPKK